MQTRVDTVSSLVVTCASRVDAVISVGLPLYRWNIFGRPSSTFIISFSLWHATPLEAQTIWVTFGTKESRETTASTAVRVSRGLRGQHGGEEGPHRPRKPASGPVNVGASRTY